ncbi:hypothetical protein SEMRO_188_G081251.1 [Seminavis robusta]|uniref:Uncharacterized protein n=1 Tax=Seminavis robusta TaxID=568900 RepID=A0A9N8H908_9STRA|nr:hypothetical protein SEMRO_188_G081251.1 [Seminavis robusta]|eukprot:Sro188_g081251.1  (153) ;mRNA; f:65642-66100
MAWVVVRALDGDQPTGRASLRYWDDSNEGTTHLQGTISLLKWQDIKGYDRVVDGFDSFRFRVELSKVNGDAVPAGSSCDIDLPKGKWEIQQPTVKRSTHGNHSGLVVDISFALAPDNGVKRIKLMLPVVCGNEECARLFFSAILHADQRHVK